MMAETNTPELANAVGTDLKQFPFLKAEQAAKEKAVESKIKAETGKEAEILKEKGLALEKIGAEDKAKYEENKSLMQPAPEFKPTQDNMMDLGGLFSLVATMGVALGGSGKLSSINALNAMGGMLKGYQAGRKDLFSKEQAIFDKETARIKEVNDRLTKDLEQYQKLRVTDKEAALIKAQEIATQNPGVIAQLVESGRDDVAAEVAKRNSDMLIKMKELATKHSVTGVVLPKDKEAIKQYTSRFQIIKNIDDIESLMQDPKYRQLINLSTGYMPDVLLNLRENFPELSQKLARIQAMEFEVGGKALTASEQKILGPIYNWRGLTAKALEERLKGVKETLNDNLAISEEVYPGFKQLRPRLESVYEKTGRVAEVPQGDGEIDIDSERSRAKAAIAKGAPEDKIKAMFKEKTGKDL
jgi:hypothetical protein